MGRLHSKVYGIQCSFCVNTLVKALSNIEGVKRVYVSSTYEEIYVEYDESKISDQEIKENIESLGYRLAREEIELEYISTKRKLLVSTTISIYIGLSMLLMFLGFWNPYNIFIIPLLSSINFFIVGFKYISMSINALKKRILNQHVLMVITGFSGIIGGVIGITIDPRFPVMDFFGVSSFVTTYHLIGGFTSEYVNRRSREAIERLKSLLPRKVKVSRGGAIIEKTIDDLEVGDIVLVEPGMRVPIDGVLVEGETYIDESWLTGEPEPRYVGPGDLVVGGSLNLSNPIRIKCERLGEEMYIAKIVEYIKLARASKPSILRLLDRILSIYVPMVLIIGVLSLISWILYGLYITGSPLIVEGLLSMLTVYVMGYPCSLGMATPLALIMGNVKAQGRGIIIRNGDVLEKINRIDTIVFDKTGTLTEGSLKIVDIHFYGEDLERYLCISACIEENIRHPISESILEYVFKHMDICNCQEISKIKYFKGLGVEAVVEGKTILLGSKEFIRSRGVEAPKIFLMDSEKAIYLVEEGKVKLIYIFRDRIRSSAYKTVEWLKRSGYKLYILSGDEDRAVEYVAGELGIENYFGSLLPWMKMDILREIQIRNNIMVVGDGINDSPILSMADIGISFNSSLDIILESSDVAIIGNDLTKIIEFISLAKKIYGKIRSNLALAFLFNGVGIPLGSLLVIGPIYAMAAMALSASTVILNSLYFK